MLDLQHLQVLRSVSDLKSVTAAAQTLNLSQSALSHMIRRLEQRYRVKLWEKDGRNLRLTQAGEYLVQLAERLLPQLDQAEQTLADLALGRRGALRVGMECHPCQRWLMHHTQPYLEQWPDVDFEVLTAFRFDGVAGLLNHEIDVLVTPDPIVSREIVFTPVYDYELVVAVAHTHRFATRTWIAPEDFIDETLITVPVGIDRLDIFTHFLIPAHCRPHKHKTAETTELMLHLAAVGRGMAVLPDWLIREEGAHLPLRIVRLGPAGLQKSINLGIRRGEETVPYIDGFVSIARSAGQTPVPAS